ncbi:hypothetical protein LINGRAHAP2_LOCUS7639, partial [Linum grandiflorum]
MQAMLEVLAGCREKTAKRKQKKKCPKWQSVSRNEIRTPSKSVAPVTPDTIARGTKRRKPTTDEVVIVVSDDSSSSRNEKVLETKLSFPDKVTALKTDIPTCYHFSREQVAVGCYIFAQGFPDDEVLFDNSTIRLKRSNFHALLPEAWLDEDVSINDGPSCNSYVLTAAAYYAAHTTRVIDDRPIWFLPAPLSIYVPMNDCNHHWYLAVVLVDEKVVHLVTLFPLNQSQDDVSLMLRK